jgi:hypothetical protein
MFLDILFKILLDEKMEYFQFFKTLPQARASFGVFLNQPSHRSSKRGAGTHDKWHKKQNKM